MQGQPRVEAGARVRYLSFRKRLLPTSRRFRSQRAGVSFQAASAGGGVMRRSMLSAVMMVAPHTLMAVIFPSLMSL